MNNTIHAYEGLDSTQNVLVQITTGTDLGDDLVGIYDLDGERVSLGNATWTVLGAAEVAAEILAEVEANYSCGTSVVTRLDAEVFRKNTDKIARLRTHT